MTASVVVGGILLAADQQLGMVERTIATGADLIDRRRVEVNEERTRDMLAAAGLGKECLKGAAVNAVRDIGVEAAIGSKAMLEEVTIRDKGEPPARYQVRGRRRVTNSSQAELPSWVPAWPI